MREPLTIQRLSWPNKLGRGLWHLVWWTLYRPSPVFMHGWRRMLLRLFGASVESGAHPYPSARIWAPWNLTMGRDSCLGPNVDCYCVAPITLGNRATVSQYSYLCTASHDHTLQDFPLVAGPITIGAQAWIAADVFLGPGVQIGDGAVIGARSTVVKHVVPWAVMAGNPAREVGRRPPCASPAQDHR